MKRHRKQNLKPGNERNHFQDQDKVPQTTYTTFAFSRMYFARLQTLQSVNLSRWNKLKKILDAQKQVKISKVTPKGHRRHLHVEHVVQKCHKGVAKMSYLNTYPSIWCARDENERHQVSQKIRSKITVRNRRYSFTVVSVSVSARSFPRRTYIRGQLWRNIANAFPEASAQGACFSLSRLSFPWRCEIAIAPWETILLRPRENFAGFVRCCVRDVPRTEKVTLERMGLCNINAVLSGSTADRRDSFTGSLQKFRCILVVAGDF